MTRQDKTRQDKTRQDKTRQDKTRQDKCSISYVLRHARSITTYIVSRIRNISIRRKWGEKLHPCNGGNEQQVFVLRRQSSVVGIGSNIIFFLGQLKYMEEYYPDAVPYFDLEHYEQSLSEHPGNVWEEFFLQPCVKIVDFEHDNYVLADATLSGKGYKLPYYIHYQDLLDNGIQRLFDRYFIIQPPLMSEFNAKKPCCFDKRVLGIKIRGTDYNAAKPGGHPIQPTVADVTPLIDKALKQYGFEYVFLATEDRQICTRMKKIYGDMLIINDSYLINYSGKKFLLSESASGSSKYAVTKDYLYELWLLSQCNGLITGNTSGVVATLLMNAGKYEYVEVIELGYYP